MMKCRRGKRKGNKQWAIIGLLSALLVFSISYALLATQLNVRGTSQISAEFNVYISSIKEKEVYKATTNSANVGQDKLTANFDVNLDVPGSYAEYTVTVKNDSNFNVELKEIVGIDEANQKSPKEIQYSVGNIYPGEVLAQGGTKAFIVRVDFDSSATSLPSTGKTLEIELNYEQTTATSILNELQMAYNKGLQQDLSNVADVIKQEFNSAMQQAKSVLEDSGATEEEINTAFIRLTRALQMLGIPN